MAYTSTREIQEVCDADLDRVTGGASLAEYGMLVGLIAVICMGAGGERVPTPTSAPQKPDGIVGAR